METQAMVINCVAYKAGKRLTDVTIDDISEVVNEPDTFIWLGLWQPEDAFMRKIQEEFGLHDLAIEDALCAHQRPKIETYGDSLFIVVKTAQWVKEEVEYGETHFFVGKNFLIPKTQAFRLVIDRQQNGLYYQGRDCCWLATMGAACCARLAWSSI
jgi:magnesium transporter